MNKREFASRVTAALRENNIRKPVTIKKRVFHITDSDGGAADFTVKQQDKYVWYTNDDVTNIIDTCIAVILDAVKRGEEIFIKGFGTLFLHYRAARRTKRPDNNEWCDVDARYVPKFNYGNDLRMAARVYELNHKEDIEDDSSCDECEEE